MTNTEANSLYENLNKLLEGTFLLILFTTCGWVFKTDIYSFDIKQEVSSCLISTRRRTFLQVQITFSDICTFLTQETQNGRLSANAKAIAKELIDRSKIQLQEISKITQTYDGDDRYVDMHCPKGDEGKSPWMTIIHEK